MMLQSGQAPPLAMARGVQLLPSPAARPFQSSRQRRRHSLQQRVSAQAAAETDSSKVGVDACMMHIAHIPGASLEMHIMLSCCWRSTRHLRNISQVPRWELIYKYVRCADLPSASLVRERGIGLASCLEHGRLRGIVILCIQVSQRGQQLGVSQPAKGQGVDRQRQSGDC